MDFAPDIKPAATAKVAKSSNRGSKPGEHRGGRTSGTPNKATLEVKEIAREYGPSAMLRIAELAGVVTGADGKPKGMAASEKVQVAALALLLDRAYGKAAQPLVGDPDNPLQLNITRIELVGPDDHGSH